MRRLLAGLTAGLAVAASMPPWGFWPLGLIGVIILGAATTGGRRSRAVTTLWFGIAWFGVGMVWMWFLTPPGYLFTTALFAGAHALAAFTTPQAPIPRALAHTLVEAARLVVPFGGVPLATIAIGQAGGPLLGVARVGGVIAITWVVFHLGLSIGARLAAVTRDGDIPSSWAAILIAPATLVMLAAVAPSGRDLGDGLTIAAVQGGGRQGTSALEVPSRLVTEAHLAATAGIEDSADLDLVVWPENTIDVNGMAFADSQQAVEVALEASRLGVPLLVGVTEDVATARALDLAANDGRGFVNAQYVVTGSGPPRAPMSRCAASPMASTCRSAPCSNRSVPRSVKSPVTRSRVPAPPSWICRMVSGSASQSLGRSFSVIGSAMACVREARSSSTRRTARATRGPCSRPSRSRPVSLRAVESGRWVVQAAPTGFSAVIDPEGQVLERTDVSERRVIVAEVRLREGLTWYSRLGDAPLAVLLVLGLLVTSRASRRPASVTPRA